MSLINKLINLYSTSRLRRIERFMRHPVQVQGEQLAELLRQGAPTAFGRDHGLEGISAMDAKGANSAGLHEEFARRVGICDYEGFGDYIMRAKSGERDVLWPGEICWFAKSSGTTDARSKYIPVSDRGLRESHLRGPADLVMMYLRANPESKLFSGKTLTLGGSKKIEREGERASSGDLSAILIEHTPALLAPWRAPSKEIALLPDFEEKVGHICRRAADMNVVALAGVPSWNLVMLNRVLDYTGKSNLLEVWPGLELFMHGGMNFRPYRERYRELIPSDGMHYMETYNASEGFFSIAERPGDEDMLLMLDYGIFYEFLPTAHMRDYSKAVPLEGVRRGVNYAMIITTSNGLWRYMIGDTVEFTSTDPYRIRITGRTKHFINAFGEEVVVENAENAISSACRETGAKIAEYSVAPIYMQGREKGAHEWVIEFAAEPDSREHFMGALDKALRQINSDYEAKRSGDTTLSAPKLSVVPSGTFIRWMEARGKTGGQNKVPRLFNDRTFADQLLAMAEEA